MKRFFYFILGVTLVICAGLIKDCQGIYLPEMKGLHYLLFAPIILVMSLSLASQLSLLKRIKTGVLLGLMYIAITELTNWIGYLFYLGGWCPFILWVYFRYLSIHK